MLSVVCSMTYIVMFGKGHRGRCFLIVDSVRSGCCSVLEKMMGRRASSMRYSYVCVVLVTCLGLQASELFSVHCF